MSTEIKETCEAEILTSLSTLQQQCIPFNTVSFTLIGVKIYACGCRMSQCLFMSQEIITYLVEDVDVYNH